MILKNQTTLMVSLMRENLNGGLISRKITLEVLRECMEKEIKQK